MFLLPPSSVCPPKLPFPSAQGLFPLTPLSVPHLQQVSLSFLHFSSCCWMPEDQEVPAHPDQPCPGKAKDARLDGRALKTLEVGLAAPSATGEMGWGSSYGCCRRKLPAASITCGDRNGGIGLQEVTHQCFAFMVRVTTGACLLWTKQREWRHVWHPSTARAACALGHVTHLSVRGFPQQPGQQTSKPTCTSSLISARFLLPWLQGSSVNRGWHFGTFELCFCYLGSEYNCSPLTWRYKLSISAGKCPLNHLELHVSAIH